MSSSKKLNKGKRCPSTDALGVPAHQGLNPVNFARSNQQNRHIPSQTHSNPTQAQSTNDAKRHLLPKVFRAKGSYANEVDLNLTFI
jgi:hypothetical protein